MNLNHRGPRRHEIRTVYLNLVIILRVSERDEDSDDDNWEYGWSKDHESESWSRRPFVHHARGGWPEAT